MAVKVKIKLTRTLPIDPACGCIEGNVYEAQYKDTEIDHDGVERRKNVRGQPVEFKGANGDRCVAFSDEYEEVFDD